MVLFFSVVLKDLFRLKKDYPWPRPNCCPKCSGRVWGHGFAGALFDGYDSPLQLKLCRCPDCGCVIRIRPKGYFERFQASIDIIRSSIYSKSTNNRWLSDLGRTRQCNWYRALCRHIKSYLEMSWNRGILKGFDYLIAKGYIPVSRSI